MLNQGRPLLRVERSGARKGKGAGWEWGAPGGRWRFWEGICFVGKGFVFLMEVVPVRAGVHLCRRVSGANTAGFGWEANEVRWVGLRIMSGGNSERTTTCFASRVS
ncbi:MAG: hypothetical protein PHT14_07860 [Petrimonas sp.]|nr:hypothetical protein [Petrimonas sp.]MDD3542991.1 hypothetical protein [Petrimonas sp.]